MGAPAEWLRDATPGAPGFGRAARRPLTWGLGLLQLPGLLLLTAQADCWQGLPWVHHFSRPSNVSEVLASVPAASYDFS